MIQELARSGLAAPEVPAERVYSRLFTAPAVNDQGEVAFINQLELIGGPSSQNEEALFGPAPGSRSTLALIAKAGDPVAGQPDGAVLDQISTHALNSAGQSSFNALLRKPDGSSNRDDNQAIFGPSVSGEPRLVAREGGVVPGRSDGRLFSELSLAQMDDAGRLLFESSLQTEAGGPIDRSFIDNIFASLPTDDEPKRVVGPFDPAFAVDESLQYTFLTRPTLNNAGVLTFSTSVTTIEEEMIIQIDPDGRHEVLARTSQVPPGLLEDGARFYDLGPFVNTPAGDLAFFGSLLEPDGSINDFNVPLLFGPGNGSGSALQVIARQGMPAPGAEDGALYFSVDESSLVMSDSGFLAFQAGLLNADGTSDRATAGALFGAAANEETPVRLLARAGQPAPGANDGAVFDRFADPLINDHGAVAFIAELRNADGSIIDIRGKKALYLAIEGDLHLVARAGQLFEAVAIDGTLRSGTVSGIGFSADSRESIFGSVGAQREYGLSNHYLAFSIYFTDGTSGVYRLAIPEPSLFGGLAVVLGVSIRRHAPRR
ncbi:MAG: choice-of-anchor tandem repeat NxxGxxAF-containing protein [Planctomycetota bacterium]